MHGPLNVKLHTDVLGDPLCVCVCVCVCVRACVCVYWRHAIHVLGRIQLS